MALKRRIFIRDLLQALGPAWLARRVWFTVERRTGLLRRRTPAVPLETLFPGPGEADAFAAGWRDHAPKLPVASLDPEVAKRWLRQWDTASATPLADEAAAIRQGRFRLFSGARADLGFPPNWAFNPLSGQCLPAYEHWTRIGDFDDGDIKGVWETSRFGWAFTLVRAWLADGDPVHVETFWRLVEDWAAKNPPHVGPNWKCGQEAAIRLFALTFSVHAFGRAAPTTPARLALAGRLAHATALRIDAHLDYALSQSNNHGISEAAGLITVGALWPMLPGAERWLARGMRGLAEQAAALVYADGGFSQHSTNYHRVLLHVLMWSDVVLRMAGRSLPGAVAACASRATRFIAALMEPDGRVHRYGADDGSDLFPLSACAYADFRPVVGAALAVFCHERYAPGPWDETAFLLAGLLPSGASPRSPAPDSAAFPVAGIHLIRFDGGSALFRAPTRFRHRPSHADQLHVDLWVGGQPLAESPGTFSYNAPGPLGAGMGEARFHNTVTVGGADPMDRVSRFLWLPWTPCHHWPDRENLVQAWHDGYQRLPSRFRHARAILTVPGGVVIVDRLTGEADDELTLRWHGRSREGLAELAVACSGSCAEAWITADERTGEGWSCPHYAERRPSWCRRLSLRARLAFFATALGTTVKLTPTQMRLGTGAWALSSDPDAPVITGPIVENP